MRNKLVERAKELLADGTVTRVIGWKRGEFSYDVTPAVFETAEELEKDFVYDGFCGANVSKYLIRESGKEGKILAFLKPCDAFSFNQLLAEHRIRRENVYAVGIPCEGMADIGKIRSAGIDGVTGIREEGEEFVLSTLYGEERIAKKDALMQKLAVYRDMVAEAGYNTGRARGTEIKVIPAVNVPELQKEADRMAKEIRTLDNLLQETNWTKELAE